MKILIAVEDKEYGKAIVDLVKENAWADQLEFEILHVLEPIYIGGMCGYPADVLVSYDEERKRAARSLVMWMGTSLREAFPSAKITETISDGQPKKVIVDRAKEWPADLLVVGSHGRGGLSQFLLGSVSMSVLSAAPCSVLIAKKPPESKTQSVKNKETAATK